MTADTLHPDGRPQEEQRRVVRQSALSRGCSCTDAWLQNASEGILNNFLWKSLIVISTLLLLIGPPIRVWLSVSASIKLMNTLFMLGFFIFVIDMIFRCYLDPNYFPCGAWHMINRGGTSNLCRLYLPNSLGSFDFWCDFLSTICFLLEITWIFTSRFQMVTKDLELTKFGFPVSRRANFNVLCDFESLHEILILPNTLTLCTF